MLNGNGQLYSCVSFVYSGAFYSNNGYRSHTHTYCDGRQFNFPTHWMAGHCSHSAEATSQTWDNGQTEQTMLDGIFEFFHVIWLTQTQRILFFFSLRRWWNGPWKLIIIITIIMHPIVMPKQSIITIIIGWQERRIRHWKDTNNCMLDSK